MGRGGPAGDVEGGWVDWFFEEGKEWERGRLTMIGRF